MDAFSPDLNAQYAWNISINNHLVGEMFVVCGVLYVVDSAEDNNSNIRWVHVVVGAPRATAPAGRGG